ncbi:hypothetical protein A3J43_01960 [Candidatus Uhrbacteria bacterium RIFCSPHIGHO2_12_FULL_54_23]|uniref:ABC transporter domain-containing protein n=3 Tax=Candidatus Uhriibacteriota TaxID=1752732 RepID=A0A1F7UH95_9BACT|nr:MAG: hypothetical protein A3J43_01960 [Candidatus Uhrbacteria bacterium RIFCSPHIGHO2_12_FULL_54_23]OGL83587.1 MAG: hypothetical protein A3B36_01025 [Candidatus Uhrbacteria bacterium RIFCSPLOWO2_01_FULL_55_36]OGL89940.1 MAG: hypothetical protein A3J36_00765 [Candidatus Uhrbacteria bacterium RIFCSPLOWO2_02_FULL_54_37]
MLRLENISKSFGSVKAVDGLSFSISPGEVVGFLGPNGAGKTTTMRMIAGILEPDSGRIEFNGADVLEEPMALKRRLGYLPENNPLAEDLLVREAIAFTATLHGLTGKKVKEAVLSAAERTGLTAMVNRPVGDLSKGYRQRVGLAQAIVTEPELLIFDEPTEGLDPNQRHEIRDLITSLGKKRTVLLSTHVLTEVASTCSRVMVIREGRLVADGTVEELEKRATGKKQVTVEVIGNGAKEGLEKIEGVVRVAHVRPVQDGRNRFELETMADADVRPEIFKLAVLRNWILVELHEGGRSLEDVFRQLTVES